MFGVAELDVGLYDKMKLTVIAITLFLGSVTASETRYRSFIADPDSVRIFWLDATGKRYGQIKQLADHLLSQNIEPAMLTNGGIFEPGGVPSGLLISDHQLQNEINVSPGKGNFFLKPNGVFYIDATGAHIVTTEEYVARRPSPRCAVQSGPSLVIDGEIHPSFNETSTSHLHRNGVGVLPNGDVIFAITEFGQDRYPNLLEFAEFFKERGCEDALFLDGDISQMETDGFANLIPSNYFGSIIAVEKNSAQQGAAANP